MKTIGVEKGLTNVADYLTQQGWSVQIITESMKNDSSSFNAFDAVVVSDYNTDFLGYNDTQTRIPVINASGLTAEEVKRALDEQISKTI